MKQIITICFLLNVITNIQARYADFNTNEVKHSVQQVRTQREGKNEFLISKGLRQTRSLNENKNEEIYMDKHEFSMLKLANIYKGNKRIINQEFNKSSHGECIAKLYFSYDNTDPNLVDQLDNSVFYCTLVFTNKNTAFTNRECFNKRLMHINDFSGVYYIEDSLSQHREKNNKNGILMESKNVMHIKLIYQFKRLDEILEDAKQPYMLISYYDEKKFILEDLAQITFINYKHKCAKYYEIETEHDNVKATSNNTYTCSYGFNNTFEDGMKAFELMSINTIKKSKMNDSRYGCINLTYANNTINNTKTGFAYSSKNSYVSFRDIGAPVLNKVNDKVIGLVTKFMSHQILSFCDNVVENTMLYYEDQQINNVNESDKIYQIWIANTLNLDVKSESELIEIMNIYCSHYKDFGEVFFKDTRNPISYIVSVFNQTILDGFSKIKCNKLLQLSNSTSITESENELLYKENCISWIDYYHHKLKLSYTSIKNKISNLFG